ncbi:hypothetical protein ACJX0J_032664, partial [Zea mays]
MKLKSWQATKQIGHSMWESVIEVLEIVHQDERNPSGADGFVGKMESSPPSIWSKLIFELAVRIPVLEIL